MAEQHQQNEPLYTVTVEITHPPPHPHRWPSHGYTGTPGGMGSTSKPANQTARSTIDR